MAKQNRLMILVLTYLLIIVSWPLNAMTDDEITSVLKAARRSLPATVKPVNVPDAMLLVSFSMPEPLLLSLANEAATYNISVVVRGLVGNDFKKTLTEFARLNAIAQKQHLNFNGVSIDPLSFQQFNIVSVPALVVSTRPASCPRATLCPNQPFDVVYGNASLKKSLELIAAKGDAAQVLAQKILDDGHA